MAEAGASVATGVGCSAALSSQPAGSVRNPHYADHGHPYETKCLLSSPAIGGEYSLSFPLQYLALETVLLEIQWIQATVTVKGSSWDKKLVHTSLQKPSAASTRTRTAPNVVHTRFQMLLSVQPSLRAPGRIQQGSVK
ncbi:hypothetical protein LY76DRAFT_608384 [Colletotrichum caudatum]|nr:hypothetical protein LY76DRAFT_608384 [Colletotrichum caudatum]